VFVAAALPAVLLAWDAFSGGLGVNPVETLLRTTGDWTLRLLAITLAITPLRRLSGWRWPQRVRRMLGLYVFFYATVHFGIYLVFDLRLDPGKLAGDLYERPFITAGAVTWLLLLPLAVTSTTGWMRRLGRDWVRLHRLVYLVPVVGVVHFWWGVKADIREPLVYALLFAALLGLRAWVAWGNPGRWLPLRLQRGGR
jgi:sulfoxide reductase heme-binding subunit YedZ